MLEDESPAKCYCVIPRRSQTSILVRRVGEQWECPSVMLPWLRLNFFPDHIPHIRRELRRETGMDLTVLRHLRDLENVQICLMEIQSVGDALPEDYLWVDSHEAAHLEWADERSAQAWRAWESLSQSEADSLTAAPWERTGWFSNVRGWIQAQLRDVGYGLTGPVEQFKGAWGWSSILKAETDRGCVYFKADYAKPPSEAAVILKLAERWPQNVPHVIASDLERNWMLLSDFGGDSLESLETYQYADALSLFARIQQSIAPDIDDWKRLGCPDMTPKNLLWTSRQLLADTAVLCDGAGGLSHAEWTEFERAIPRIEDMLAQLASSVVPMTICNEDFRAGNIVARGEEYLFYDWSGAVISHPLFGINYFLNRMVRSDSEDGFRWRNDLEDARRRELLSAFLSQWTNYASWDDLVSEFWLCRRLYHLYEAVKCYCDLPYLDATSPWGSGARNYIPSAIRKLIAALDYELVNNRLS